MKKVLYICAVVFISSLAFTSCTEEEIKPNDQQTSGGGGASFDPIED